MWVITNREVDENKSDLSAFGRGPNASGPNELRLVEVTGTSAFAVKVLKDKLSKPDVKALLEKYKEYEIELDLSQDWYMSLSVACRLYDKARREDKHILLFVHGYNNDMKDVIRTARALEKLYNVIAVPFSWPANGGGKISGTTAYLSDKDDARSSATAFHRAVQKIHFYHQLLTEAFTRKALEAARKKFPDSSEKAHAHFTEIMEKQCKTRLNLMCHSMGNYVLKYASQPGESSLKGLVFDNITLVAADTNNPGHEKWVEGLPVRNRLFVVVNENDGALAWSRRKPGDEQLERLGHHLRNLVARNAYYIDVTRNRGVGSEHSYFKGKSVEENATLRQVFGRAFEGGKAELGLTYNADINVYRS